MAPEQADGRTRDIGPATDVYAVGAILYECLTGRPPFKTGSRQETMEQVRSQPPLPPRQLRAEVPAELEAVCLRCLEKSVGKRYATAADLAADLRRWLEGQAVQARHPAAERRGLRALGSRRLLAGLAVAALAVVCAWSFSRALPRRAEGTVPPLEDIQSRLAAGQRVVLLGDTGQPLLCQWALGEQGALHTQDEDGAFTISTTLLSMLELLPGPGTDRYRLRAEIRHRVSNPGPAGLYVAHQQKSSPGPAHQFLEVSFNDVIDAGQERAEILKVLPKAKLPRLLNGVSLRPAVYAGQGWQQGNLLRGSGQHKRLFKAAGRNGNVWRILTVEVTAEEVRAFWGEPPVAAGALTARQLENDLRDVLAKAPPAFPARDVPQELASRGALGLLVEQGVASFRNITIEPLPAP
jgi:serine/threonine-protein kinase